MSWPLPGASLGGRCFLCGGVLRHGHGMRPCRYCGTAQAPAPDGVARRRRAALLASLRPGRWRAPGGADWRLDEEALRMAAGLRGLGLHGGATGTLAPALPSASGLTVVILARPGDAAAAALARDAAGFADAVLLMLDGEGEGSREGTVRRVFRPLNDDFGAQRNAAQALVRTPWALHLDADERPDAALLSTLRRAVGVAERAGRRAVGFPRINLVDGVPSGLFPDTQYRLLRREERFVGAVHERPAACADPSATTQWLAGALVHQLSRARVTARKARYDAMGQAPAQAREATDLLTPFPTRGDRGRPVANVPVKPASRRSA